MNSMKDREEAFENKFAHDQETKFRAIVRRNKLVGLWAADLLGKSGGAAEEYAKEVIASDFARSGHDDVIEKIRADFDAAGVHTSNEEIGKRMIDLLAVAADEVQKG